MRADEQIIFTAANPPLRCGRAIWFRRGDMRALSARTGSTGSQSGRSKYEALANSQPRSRHWTSLTPIEIIVIASQNRVSE